MAVVRIPVPTPTRAPGGRTNAYILSTESAILVDPAAPSDELTDAIDEHDVSHVAVTHHHPDHVGGVAEYADEFGLTVWARAGRVSEFRAATGIVPDETFSPGEMLPVAGGVRVMDTPGHAPEHIGLLVGTAVSNGTDVDDGTVVNDEAGGGGTELLVGDLAVAAGSVVVGAPEGDMRAYLSSLRRVIAKRPDRLLPAHGSVIDSPQECCRRLIQHRLRRERRIYEAVLAGTETPEEILEAAYEKDISGVIDLARATVIAHLEKLAVEGKVTWDGSRATPIAG